MVAPSVDLLALLRPAEVVVAVGGRPFTLTATTASQWLGAIATDMNGMAGIMPGLVADEDLPAMIALMDSHPDIEDRWLQSARTALGRAAGRDWWWALNLCRKSLNAWMYINGILLRQNVDAKKLSLPDWLDACYTMLWQGCDEEQQVKLDLELSMPPRGVGVRRSRDQVKADLAAFAAD